MDMQHAPLYFLPHFPTRTHSNNVLPLHLLHVHSTPSCFMLLTPNISISPTSCCFTKWHQLPHRNNHSSSFRILPCKPSLTPLHPPHHTLYVQTVTPLLKCKVIYQIYLTSMTPLFCSKSKLSTASTLFPKAHTTPLNKTLLLLLFISVTSRPP